MALDAEDIYASLFALTTPLAFYFKTLSRILKHNADVPKAMQPALFQTEITEAVTQLSGTKPVWHLKPVWTIYLDRGENNKKVASTQINEALALVRGAFAVPAGLDKLTLGGKVNYCRMGDVEIDEGVLGQQAIVQVSIDILVPEDSRC